MIIQPKLNEHFQASNIEMIVFNKAFTNQQFHTLNTKKNAQCPIYRKLIEKNL